MAAEPDRAEACPSQGNPEQPTLVPSRHAPHPTLSPAPLLPILAALVATLPAFANQGPAAPEAVPPGREPQLVPAVVVYREDLGLRDRLLRVAHVHTDAGRYVVAHLDPRLEPALERHGAGVELLPELGTDERMWLVPLHELGLVGTELPSGDTRVLFRGPLGAPSLVALDARAEGELRALLAAGGHGHCALAPIPTRRVRPAPAARWRGLAGASGVLEMSSGDPRIQALVDQVDAQQIESRVSQLAALFTRRADQPGAVTAQNLVKGWFDALGLATSTQDFSSSYSENVIAEIPGALDPNKVVVVGAHYDSVNWQGSATAQSPGADDNASGSAGVLEAARVLATGGPYEHTLRFVLFSAEEFGLIGSDANAAQSLAVGEEILGMLNMDMIAYRAPGDARDVDFVTDNASTSLTEFCDAVGALYVPNWASTQGSLSGGSSDHAAYFAYGIPSAFYFEDTTQFTPFIHTQSDSSAASTNDFELAQMIVRGAVAAAATLAEPVDLDLAHAPLADTTDGVGPYLVTADVASLTGSDVVGVDLHFSGDGSTFTTVAMTDQGNGSYTGLIPGFGSPVTISYWVQAFDDEGGSETSPLGADLGGLPHWFFVGSKNVVYSSDFEGPSDEGWTHVEVATQDDWQRGAPNGKGGDPLSAASGTSVWGNDLGPSGFNGTYQPNVINELRSPSIDASGTSSLSLEFQRWLTIEDAAFDQAQILVNDQLVWQNPIGSGTDHLEDTGWVPFELDVSAAGAGSSDLRVEFRLVTDGGLEFGGWNIDDIELVEEGPAPPPPPPSFTLEPSALSAVGYAPIVASGTGMGGVQTVTVGGAAVAFEQGAGEVIFLAPAATTLGPADVVVTTAIGSASAPLDYQANSGTVLVGSTQTSTGSTATFVVGDPDPGLAWLVFSALSGPTSLPGIVDLAIGGGNPLAVFVAGSGPLNAAGTWAQVLPIPQNPALSGASLHFEGVAFGPDLALEASGAHVLGID